MYEMAKRTPVSNSISGYCLLMGALQYRHLPFSHSQLKTGTRSFIARTCLQLGHMLRPCKIESSLRCFFDSFFGSPSSSSCWRKRHTQAFIKLPKISPSANKYTTIKTLILKSISYKTCKKKNG